MLNILGLIAVASILAQAPSAQGEAKVYPDRAKFAEQRAKVESGSLPAQVELLLGRPENIRRNENTEVWQYGLEGPEKVPTLGEVTFVDGKVYGWSSRGEPPPTSLISEAELREGIWHIYASPDCRAGEAGILHAIRSVNYLRRLGPNKSRAILAECANALSGYDDDLHRIAFALFDKSIKMQQPGIFIHRPLRAPYSVSIVEGVPFYIQEFWAEWSGPGVSFRDYLNQIPLGTPVRSSDLIPSDDPFASLIKLLNSPELRNHYPDKQSTWPRPYTPGMVREVLALVRTAFRPVDSARVDWDNRRPYHLADFAKADKEVLADVENLQAEFKKAGVRWDARKQLYVRRDGSYDKAAEPNPRRAATTQSNQP